MLTAIITFPIALIAIWLVNRSEKKKFEKNFEKEMRKRGYF